MRSVVLLALVGSYAVANASARLGGPAITDPEAYAVYAAAMRPGDQALTTGPSAIAIQIETLPGPLDCPRAAQITDEWRAAVDDYRQQNAATKFIRPGFDVGIPYSLVPAFQIVQMLKDDGLLGADGYRAPDAPQTNAPGWRVFSQFAGGHVVALSAVGFNSERTRAIVAVQHDCIVLPNGHSFCHGFDVSGIKKVNGRWEPAPLIGCHGEA